ncbi:hypothetical protein ACNOYE_13060 [Nannocystaceae bacterium ST9]
MTTTLLILCSLAPIAAIDVLYYHIYRFRLYAQDSSVGEQLTHLLRHATILAIVALLGSGVRSPWADASLLALFAFDLINSAADVWLEPRSRAPLGGLPRGEYFLHFLGIFGTGLATASYLYERTQLPIAAPTGLLAVQVAAMLGIGAILFMVEAGLFVRARLAARGGLVWACCGRV